MVQGVDLRNTQVMGNTNIAAGPAVARSKTGTLYGALLGLVGFYFISYLSMLWVAFDSIWPGPAEKTSGHLVLIPMLIILCLGLVAVVHLLPDGRRGFIGALAVLLVAGIIAAVPLLDEPLSTGTTAWLALGHVLANAGRNPIALGVLLTTIFHGLFLELGSRRSAS
jgi:hypothetical protein